MILGVIEFRLEYRIKWVNEFVTYISFDKLSLFINFKKMGIEIIIEV